MADVFDFRPGRSIKNVDPQAAGETLNRLLAEKGQLIPADVVEQARDANSPLHPAFEWDDSRAAQQHRLNQARRLIASVRIVNGPVQTPVPAFVSVRTPDRGRSYLPTMHALSDEQLRARVLLEVRQFIESLEKRYAHFHEVANLLSGLKQRVA